MSDNHLKVTYRLHDITSLFTSKPSYVDRIFEVLALNEKLSVHCCSSSGSAECWPRGIVCSTNEKYNSEKHGEALDEFETDNSGAGDDVSYWDWSDLSKMPVAEVQDFKQFPEDHRDLGHRDIDNGEMYTPYYWDLNEILDDRTVPDDVVTGETRVHQLHEVDAS